MSDENLTMEYEYPEYNIHLTKPRSSRERNTSRSQELVKEKKACMEAEDLQGLFLKFLGDFCNSPYSFSATVRTAGKVFSGNEGCEIDPSGGVTTPVPVAGMPIKDDTECAFSTKGVFG